MEKDQQFVEDVVKMIVDNPKDVKVERTVDDLGVLLTLHVHAEDMGKVIGKEGQTAKALRTLLRVFGARNDERVNLKIAEPEGSERPEKPPREEKAKEAVEEAPVAADEEPALTEPVAATPAAEEEPADETAKTEAPTPAPAASDEEEKVTELV